MQPTNGCCMQEAGMTLKKEEYTVRVPRSQRGGEIIEPLLREQWFVRMKPLAEPALQVGSACSPYSWHFGTNIAPDSLILLRNTCFCCFPMKITQLTRKLSCAWLRCVHASLLCISVSNNLVAICSWYDAVHCVCKPCMGSNVPCCLTSQEASILLAKLVTHVCFGTQHIPSAMYTNASHTSLGK